MAPCNICYMPRLHTAAQSWGLLASDEPSGRNIVAAWRQSHNHGTWDAGSMVTHKDTQKSPASGIFHYRFPLPCHDLPAQAKQLAVGAAPASGSSATDSWPGKEHSPLSEAGTTSVARHFWSCFPIQWLPLACAVFFDFPMTSLCLSGHLTLETDCNGNTFTSAINSILPKSKTSTIHIISVPSSAFSIFLPSSFHTVLEHGPESPFP